MIQVGGAYAAFCQDEGILLQKYRDRNGRCVLGLLYKALPLKPRIFSKKSVVLEKKAKIDLLKHFSPDFSRVFCPKADFSKSIFAFYQNERFFTKILAFKGRGS